MPGCHKSYSPEPRVGALAIHEEGHCGENVAVRTRGALGVALTDAWSTYFQTSDARVG